MLTQAKKNLSYLSKINRSAALNKIVNIALFPIGVAFIIGLYNREFLPALLIGAIIGTAFSVLTKKGL